MLIQQTSDCERTEGILEFRMPHYFPITL